MDSVDGFCLHLKIRLRQLSDFEFPNTLETIKKVFLMAAEDSWKPLIKTINHKFRKWCLICQPWNFSNLWYQKDSKKFQFFPRKTHKLIHFWPNWEWNMIHWSILNKLSVFCAIVYLLPKVQRAWKTQYALCRVPWCSLNKEWQFLDGWCPGMLRDTWKMTTGDGWQEKQQINVLKVT